MKINPDVSPPPQHSEIAIDATLWMAVSVIRTLIAAIPLAFVTACTEVGPSGSAASGEMGDLQAGTDGDVGGISDIPNPSATMATKSGKSLTAIQRGHEIFMLKCGECHYYMMPENVDLMDWEDTMPEMIRHAGLGRAEERAVLDYVIAVRAMHGLRD